MGTSQLFRRAGFRLCLILLLSAVGCSTFGSRYQTIRVSSEPTSAEVYIDNEPQGTTPAKFKVRRNQDLVVEVRKPGYRTGFRTLSSGKPSTLGMLDMIGGVLLLIPFFGLISDAAWDYDRGSYAIRLERLSEEHSLD